MTDRTITAAQAAALPRRSGPPYSAGEVLTPGSHAGACPHRGEDIRDCWDYKRRLGVLQTRDGTVAVIEELQCGGCGADRRQVVEVFDAPDETRESYASRMGEVPGFEHLGQGITA